MSYRVAAVIAAVSAAVAVGAVLYALGKLGWE